MKKIFMCASALMLSVAVFAQSSGTILKELEDRDGVVSVSSPSGIVSFNMFSHVGFGFSIAGSDAIEKGGSNEYFLNVAQVSVFPLEHLGLELNADVHALNFISTSDAFVQTPDHRIVTSPFSIFGEAFEKAKSEFTVWSASFPVLLKAKVEGFSIGAGAEAYIPFAANNKSELRRDNRKVTVKEKKAATGDFTYAFIATASYDDLGLYFKYFPKASGFLAEGSVPLDFWTIGMSIGF